MRQIINNGIAVNMSRVFRLPFLATDQTEAARRVRIDRKDLFEEHRRSISNTSVDRHKSECLRENGKRYRSRFDLQAGSSWLKQHKLGTHARIHSQIKVHSPTKRHESRISVSLIDRASNDPRTRVSNENRAPRGQRKMCTLCIFLAYLPREIRPRVLISFRHCSSHGCSERNSLY